METKTKLKILLVIEAVLFVGALFTVGLLIWVLLLPVADYFGVQNTLAMNIATFLMGYMVGARAWLRKQLEL